LERRLPDVTTGGACLGPVGGRIVAEVVITLLERDPESVLSKGGEFQPRGSLIDLLRGDPVL
jgi:hypothetical protein